ncbi:MAG: hypothetical protein ACD_28C00295G0003 [uncultured bacterium]|nr:MAG: hypothetical protein ACD_28C00295G0003 [uncultured bacterium]
MTDTHVTFQFNNVMLFEHLADQSVSFSQMKLIPIVRHDAGCVLAAVLKTHQAVINILNHVIIPNDANNSTHESIGLRIIKKGHGAA